DPWLLIKVEDEAARSAKQQDILEEKSRSVVTGRSIDEIAAGRAVKKQSARKTTAAKAVWHSSRARSAPKAPPAKAANGTASSAKSRRGVKSRGATKSDKASPGK